MMPYEMCPKGCDLTGEPIDKDCQKFYGGRTHFSRVLGIEVQGIYDGICYWSCPDCGEEWLREGLPDRVRVWFEENRTKT